MGRVFVEHVKETGGGVFKCRKCRVDVASSGAMIWEGFMGAQQRALLFRNVVNLNQFSGLREEQLSTGTYVLADVECRCCCTPLGWRYMRASNHDQQYKEGTTLLQQALLVCVKPDSAQAGDGEGGEGEEDDEEAMPGLSSDVLSEDEDYPPAPRRLVARPLRPSLHMAMRERLVWQRRGPAA